MRRLLMLSLLSVAASGMSGCCLFCHSYGGACGPSDYGQCAPSGYGHGRSYGACVSPPGCPECATGMYAAHIDPVDRARAMRLERMRRQRGYAYGGRMPQQHHHQRQRMPRGMGYGDAVGMDGLYGYDDGMMYDDMAYGFDDGMMLGDGWDMTAMGGEWMPSSTPCNCQDGMSGQFVEGGWVEGQVMEATPTPSAAPATTSPTGTEPTAMPPAQVVPDPIPVTQDQYFSPLPAPGSEVTVESDTTTAGSPIQPVLWAPNGL